MGRVVEIPGQAAPTWRTGVAAEASLPASGNSLYDVRASLDDELLYLWNGSAWVAMGGSGDLLNPVITGSAANFFDDLLVIADGGDRAKIKGDVIEICSANGDVRLYIAKDFPQVSVIASDLWIEQNGTGAGMALLTHNSTDCGWSSIQQAELPGVHAFRDIWLGRNLRWATNSADWNLNYGAFFAGGRLSFKMDQYDIVNPGGTSYAEFRHASATIASSLSLRFDLASSGIQYYAPDARRFGKATLVAGVATVNHASITTTTEAHANCIDVNGSTGIGAIEAKCTASTLTITSRKADGTVETGDTSIVSYMLVQPIS